MTQTATLLGIESSCDETAAAVVRAQIAGGSPSAPQILGNTVWSQEGLHEIYGGVVPEIAARAHVERLDDVIRLALQEAGTAWEAIDAVAVTAGPGLIGGVLSGVITAKMIAAARGLPLLGINHLEGHALTPRLTDGLAYPYLLLLASGGHCQLIAVEALGCYRRLGGTIDDSPGEAFDKIAKYLGLGFPGGPLVERWAGSGDAARFALPRPLMDRPGADMSFSGLKTALRLAADAQAEMRGAALSDGDVADLCASFQAAVCDVLAEKTRRAVRIFVEEYGTGFGLAVAGGVAANTALRAALQAVAAEAGLRFVAPPLKLCTDNAAMIAWAGLERFARSERHALDEVQARPRWPLDESAAPMLGSGKRGAKA
ncbi:MAG: tRNA (adenosine(37)-N6)-threonylcarbamoyltransferase complex transferase subunit TsaD [Neomegalonema sp.]|nr:tRNA (adenosine(37)-N6)-threonylcarbamoyltransferase complex transferase subunit TsaD [Neomegalonema sp.]